MTTLTVTAKGQVTLRRALLDHLGVRPGDRLSIRKLGDGALEVRAARVPGDISAVFGLLERKDAAPVSLDAMDAIIAEGWAGKR